MSIGFASAAWPRPGLAEPRSASIAGFGNNGPLSSTEQKRKDCNDQDKQVHGASFGFVFGT